MNSLQFTVWVTTECNLECTYCYERTRKNKDYISNDTVKNLVQFIAQRCIDEQSQKCMVHFHGGEPLLAYQSIYEIVTQLKELLSHKVEINFSITTNGTLLKSDIDEFLIQNFQTISVSLDGNRSSHDSYRKFRSGKGSHDIVVTNLLRLISKNSFIRIRMTITSYNVDHFYENIVYLLQSGFIYISPAIDLFDDMWTIEKVQILMDEIDRIKEFLKLNVDVPLSIDLINNHIYEMNGCGGGKYNFNIDVYGDIYPCTFSVGQEQFKIGDIFHGVDDQKLKMLENLNMQQVKDCIGCIYYKNCITSNCKIINYILTGDSAKASPIICAIENLKLRCILMDKNQIDIIGGT